TLDNFGPKSRSRPRSALESTLSAAAAPSCLPRLRSRFRQGPGGDFLLRPPGTGMKTVVFATVGTTSFDDLVQSLCSLPFLAAMANYHHREPCRRGGTKETSSPYASPPSSSPSPSASLSSPASSWPGPPSSSCSTSSSSSPAVALPSTSWNDDYEPSLELVIQYGRGVCPLSFLPRSLLDKSKSSYEAGGSDSGSTIISIPVSSWADVGDISNTKLPAALETKSDSKPTIQTCRVCWYGFRASLSSDMERADVIICHAGAGTLLEALDILSSNNSVEKRKVINAVINTKLMDNHQSELADELERRKLVCITRDCAQMATESGATKFWEGIRNKASATSAEQWDRGTTKYPSQFQRIVDRALGLHHHDSSNHVAKKAR
ncbi:hypothetical protein ACHAWF_004750, partial [Thalassiosira exigua]